MKKSIKKNYILNLIYEMFALLVPIFVMPYVSRILGADGVGIYSYTYSIIYYFMLIGALGFTTYARRELAKLRENPGEQYKLFWEITFIKIFTTVISIILYELIIFIFFKGTIYFVYLQSIIIYLIGTALDIIYFFQANEDFGKIVYKNIFIKILGVFLIFCFVKSQNDLYVYILLQALIFIVSNLLLWFTLPREVFKTRIKKINIKNHIKPALKLFIPTVASSIYTVLDKTLIGIIVTDQILVNGELVNVANVEIGVYEQVEKLIKMTITVLTSLCTIISPRNSYYFAKNQFDKIKEITKKSYSFVFLLSLPMIFGLLLISKDFCPMFFGNGYEKAPLLMNCLSLLIFFIGTSGIFGMQYLTAIGKDNKYIISVSIGAVVNLLLNLILIPKFLSLGAAISTVIAEFIILVFLLYFSKEVYNIRDMFKTFIKYFIGAVIMYFFANLIIIESAVINVFTRMIVAVLIYFIYLLLIRDNLVFEAFKIMNKIASKFQKRKV